MLGHLDGGRHQASHKVKTLIGSPQMHVFILPLDMEGMLLALVLVGWGERVLGSGKVKMKKDHLE